MRLSTSDILSLIAIIVSLGSAAYQWYLDSHMNQVNLESEYFKSLYSKHLLYDLPIARKYIRFDQNKLVDIDLLIDQLNSIRNDSLFFKYADIDFYTDAKIVLQQLEDYLIDSSQRVLTDEEQKTVLEQIEIKLKSVYRTFGNKYIGKQPGAHPCTPGYCLQNQ